MHNEFFPMVVGPGYEDEQYWLPNPYQEQADAQVRAGAWPGTPLLMCCKSPSMSSDTSQMTDGSNWGMHPESALSISNSAACDSFSLVYHSQEAATHLLHVPQHGSPCHWESSAYHWQQQATNCIASTSVLPDETLATFGAHVCTDFESKEVLAGTCNLYDNISTDEDYDALPSPESSHSGEITAMDFKEAAQATEESDETALTVNSSSGNKSERTFSRKLSHQCVPKKTDFTKTSDKDIERDKITTLMLRNIPNMYTRSMLVEELGSLGFKSEYDFLYLPMDKSTQWNVGYSFVNFKCPSVAKRFANEVTGHVFRCYDHRSGKVAQVAIAHIQGLEKNLAYYSNTAVQCDRVQTYRPLVLAQAQQEEGGGATHKVTARRQRARALPGTGASSAKGGWHVTGQGEARQACINQKTAGRNLMSRCHGANAAARWAPVSGKADHRGSTKLCRADTQK